MTSPNSPATVEAPTIRWNRLDLPGNDAARLRRRSHTWHLTGSAIFTDQTGQWDMDYAVDCADDWTTIRGSVKGTRDGKALEISVARAPEGRWSINGQDVPAVTGCEDIDLAFTPATNLLSIRRLNLSVGQEADVVAAWLTFPAFSLVPLCQRYRRISRATYAYSAPDLQFAAMLTVDDNGFVNDYPGLWRAEA